VEIATVDGQYDSTVYYLIGCYGDGGGGGGGGGGSGSGGAGGSASSAPSNGIIQKLQNFQNACGNKYQAAIAVSDTVGYVGLASTAVSGVASLTNAFGNTLTTNATQLASQVGGSIGMSGTEVIAHGAEGGVVSIAQDVALAGTITGQVGSALSFFGKVSGAVSLGATAASLGIRAGCAAGWW